LLENSVARRSRPSAAKAYTENTMVIAAVNRCATQRQEQSRVFSATCEAGLKNKTVTAAVNCCATQKQMQKPLAGRCRGIPPLRTKRARMGHPPSHAATPKTKNKIEFLSNL